MNNALGKSEPGDGTKKEDSIDTELKKELKENKIFPATSTSTLNDADDKREADEGVMKPSIASGAAVGNQEDAASSQPSAISSNSRSTSPPPSAHFFSGNPGVEITEGILHFYKQK